MEKTRFLLNWQALCMSILHRFHRNVTSIWKTCNSGQVSAYYFFFCQTGLVCKQIQDPIDFNFGTLLANESARGPNFAEVRFNYSSVFSWLINEGTSQCRNDLSCFSFWFQQRIRQASEHKISTVSNQFSFKDKEMEAQFNILQFICFSGIVW